ncbi:MAG: hypothetical protein AAF620_01175 [Bacteroidota bacterium]
MTRGNPMHVNNPLDELIQQALIKYGLTNEVIRQQLGITRATYTKYRKNPLLLSAGHIIRLSDIIHVSPQRIFLIISELPREQG